MITNILVGTVLVVVLYIAARVRTSLTSAGLNDKWGGIEPGARE